MHSWAPQGKNSFVFLGWVVTHSLTWQPARWKGKCQTISGCKNKPLPGPRVKPPDSGNNSPLANSFRPEKKKEFYGCTIPPSVIHNRNSQNHCRQCVWLSKLVPQTKQSTGRKAAAGIIIFITFQHFPQTKHCDSHVAFILSFFHSCPRG